ncbi:MAG: hypothetical protein FWH03_01975 [Firmicutes bacterium]|nr:hypothetical protein [Bacillota bacterium]
MQWYEFLINAVVSLFSTLVGVFVGYHISITAMIKKETYKDNKKHINELLYLIEELKIDITSNQIVPVLDIEKFIKKFNSKDNIELKVFLELKNVLPEIEKFISDIKSIELTIDKELAKEKALDSIRDIKKYIIENQELKNGKK